MIKLNFKIKVFLIIFFISFLFLIGLSAPRIKEHRLKSYLKKAKAYSSEFYEQKYQDMKLKNKYKLVYITNPGGEYSYAEYMKIAAKKNWLGRFGFAR